MCECKCERGGREEEEATQDANAEKEMYALLAVQGLRSASAMPQRGHSDSMFEVFARSGWDFEIADTSFGVAADM